jgi:hypothetical protein
MSSFTHAQEGLPVIYSCCAVTTAQNYFEPCVPDGCAENIVTDAPGFEAFGIPAFVGCCVGAFAEPP